MDIEHLVKPLKKPFPHKTNIHTDQKHHNTHLDSTIPIEISKIQTTIYYYKTTLNINTN